MEHLISLADSAECKPCAAEDLSFFEEADKDEKASDGSSLHHKPLHRVYSYMRMAGAKTLVREETFDPWEPFRRDERALAKRLGIGKLSSEWVRLSFFATEFSRIGDLRHLCDQDYLGYCILRKIPDHGMSVGSLQRLQVWEAVLRQSSLVNSYLHTARVYDGYVGCRDKGRKFRVRGSYYAQQDGATSICSHVALMTVLNDMRQTGSELVRAADINEKLGIDHSDPKQHLGDRGDGTSGTLKSSVHQDILRTYGFKAYFYQFLNSPVRDYSEFVYPFIESGCGCVLHFGRTASGIEEDDAHGHVVPLVGHTFNSDLWMPEAGLGYGGLQPENATILDSRQWVDHYLIHDDNYGMYMNLPSSALKQQRRPEEAQAESPTISSAKDGANHQGEEVPLVAKYAVAALPGEVLMYARDAALRATSLLCFFRDKVRDGRGRWLRELFRSMETKTETGVSESRAGAGRRARAPVFRPVLMDREHLLDHWAKVNAFSSDDREARQDVESALPELVWLVEASISEILTVNRAKTMDFAIDATRHFESNTEPWKTCPVVRAPSGFFFPGDRWRSLRAHSGDTYVPICRNPRNPPPPER